jgi:uncharacterized protein YnzC (UPF0291/DUF896 family)
MEVINVMEQIESVLGTDVTRDKIKKFKENEWILQ